MSLGEKARQIIEELESGGDVVLLSKSQRWHIKVRSGANNSRRVFEYGSHSSESENPIDLDAMEWDIIVYYEVHLPGGGYYDSKGRTK